MEEACWEIEILRNSNGGTGTGNIRRVILMDVQLQVKNFRLKARVHVEAAGSAVKGHVVM